MTQTHKTAIKRKKLSTPMQYLDQHNLIKGNALDYGSGYGNDAKLLRMHRYDPFFQPTIPYEEEYKTITCNYVLNVIPHEQRETTIRKMIELLELGGIIYLSVRNDIKGGQQEGRGCTQYNVTIPTSKHYNFKQLKKTSSYRLYFITPTWR